MKTKIYLIVLLGIIQTITLAQKQVTVASRDSIPFNVSFWNAYAEKLNLSPSDKNEFLSSHKRTHNSTPFTDPNNQRPFNPNQQNIFAGPCVNIDFENGNYNGWTTGTGFHPLYNPLGCCPNPGGQQTIMTGGGLDPLGNFPVVAPGGNFSLRLGNNINGGQADKIEQTFLVSPGNANFTYRYAVVFQDPGHIASEQPAFKIEMLDTLGGQVPCTFYNVSAGQNIPGFLNSPNQGVVYKPWSTVMVDLTSYIGQNITIRFTTYDCALGGHYGYAYLDGSCQAFVSGTSDTICLGGTKYYCAPNGLASYTWNGPGVVNTVGQCITATVAGIYTCQTTLFTNCNGPQFTYTLSNFPTPVVSFNKISANACAPTYTFINTSSIVGGFIASYNWNFGGGNTSALQNPVYTFPGVGTFPVGLTATSDKSCAATSGQTLAIYPNPTANFIFTNTCQNAVTNFTNTSTITQGSIIGNNWSFGNGNSSPLLNPNQTYLNNGNYVVNLSVTSNQNCISTVTNVITIHPLPNVSFNVSNVCQGNNSNFINTSNIASGNIINYVWDFDNNGQPNSFLVNPAYTYPAVGTYMVLLSAVSNFNCVNSTTAIANVFANPTASFTANNVCFGQTTSFTNQTSIPNGGQIINYIWNLGNGNMTSSVNPQYNYNAPGNYVVSLTAQSNNGCYNTFTSSAMVHHLPIVNFIPTKACHNQATQFNNTTIINTGTIAKWRWDFENDGIWDDTLSVYPNTIYSSPGIHTGMLQAVSNFGCVSTKTNIVTVYHNPVANFLTQTACLGDVSTFTNVSTSQDGPILSYEWDFNGDNVIDNVLQNPTLTYSTNGIYLLKLEVQTIYGCVNVKSKSMYVNPKPVPVFAAPSNSGCPNFCVTFTNSSTIATGSIVGAYWQYGDGSATEANMQSPTHCYGTGNYNVSLILVSDSGCRSTLKKPGYVTVYPQPVAGFKIEPEEVDENSPVISVTSSAIGADKITYFINDNSVIYNVNFNYTLKNVEKVKPLIYQVVKNQYGCADTIAEIIKIKPSWVIYIPNTFTPNSDGVNDSWFAKGVGITKFNVQVYDRWGHVIFETNNMDEAWNGKTKGSTEPIKQDVYVWRALVTDVFNKNHEMAGTVTLLKSE